MRSSVHQSLRELGAYLGSLIHRSVRDDVVGTARHRSFIAAHLLAGFLALCVLPFYLWLSGAPTLLDAVAFLWFLSPITIAVFLSRTGRLAVAHLISAANFVGLITFSAWLTGGITSFLLPWMVAVPLAAALSSYRRVVSWSFGLASIVLFTPS